MNVWDSVTKVKGLKLLFYFYLLFLPPMVCFFLIHSTRRKKCIDYSRLFLLFTRHLSAKKTWRYEENHIESVNY